jgi:hypothetical protein
VRDKLSERKKEKKQPNENKCRLPFLVQTDIFSYVTVCDGMDDPVN